ncbi:MAG: tautomerase family protein [Pseudolysinimonas sp.]|uniref:tautomerase family protein n=1 Tax=Pseudolysinimonas sp. TaxID=2680009 RepID=UPI0032666D55
MPKILVEVRRPYSSSEVTALLDSVHAAMVAAFRIPPGDRGVRLIEYDPERFAVSPELTQPDRYTLITIECFAGRSVDAKRALYREIAERLEMLGIPSDHISVVIHEISRENWGMRGIPASDVELSFKVDV